MLLLGGINQLPNHNQLLEPLPCPCHHNKDTSRPRRHRMANTHQIAPPFMVGWPTLVEVGKPRLRNSPLTCHRVAAED